MTIKAVYVEQFGAYWRLRVDEWRRLLGQIIRGDGYVLSEIGERTLGRPLAGRPRCVCTAVRGEGRTASLRADLPLFHPLDWTAEDAQDALNELES